MIHSQLYDVESLVGFNVFVSRLSLESVSYRDMELGYAITLHKAQGSQFPRIIIALQKGKIVDRAWLYTAITRAEAEIHTVGSSDELRIITESHSNSHKRNSYLAELLRQN